MMLHVSERDQQEEHQSRNLDNDKNALVPSMRLADLWPCLRSGLTRLCQRYPFRSESTLTLDLLAIYVLLASM
jgi:hypothetical protein